MEPQYRDASNLRARIELHRRFGREREPWTRWVFDRLDLPDSGSVLELGCGPADLWAENPPASCHIILSDLSPGMLRDARHHLGQQAPRFQLLATDARSLPFREGSFDRVLANHMLYHVPDRAKALSEIDRVLKAGGKLCATTIGRHHMQELWELVEAFDAACAPPRELLAVRFGLETGGEQLSRIFGSVELLRQEDSLEVTQAEPLVAYVLSTEAGVRLRSPDRRDAFRAFVQDRLASSGPLSITRQAGMFRAVKSE